MLRMGRDARNRRTKRKEANQSRFSFNAVPVETSAHPRANPSPTRELIHFSQGRTFTQFHNLSQVRSAPPSPEKSPGKRREMDENDNVVHAWDTDYAMVFQSQPTLPSRHRKRRATQWETWRKTVIPSLIDPWLRYLQSTKSLRDPPPLSCRHVCTCEGKNNQLLTIRVIRFFGEWPD